MKTNAYKSRRALLSLLLGSGLMAFTAAAQDKGVRVLFDFEDSAEVQVFGQGSENVSLDRSPDNAFTGKYCCRAVFAKGAPYAVLYFNGEQKAGWQDYDYFAMDVYVPGSERSACTLELLDARATNYVTRCSLHTSVVPGRQTILIPINHPRRNGKEGRNWSELEPQDKVDLRAMVRCKFFVTPPQDHDLVWFVDNIRLLKEDALGLKMTVPLPTGASAFCFGKGKPMDGFTATPAASPAFVRKGDLADCGKSWPDPLTGNGVYSPSGKPFSFETALPDGDYRVWVAAGMVLRRDIGNPRFRLKVGGTTVLDDTPAAADLYGEKYFFRFLHTRYSERPNALWLDFIDRMYPVYEVNATVTGGKLAIEACGMQLSALIALPAKEEAAFAAMSNVIREERIRLFYASQKTHVPRPVTRGPDEDDFLCFVPDALTVVRPDTTPGRGERGHNAYDLAAAPGQNLIFRLGISAFKDLGTCTVTLSDLKGTATIPASSARWFFQDYRLRGIDPHEEALIPANQVLLENGLTRSFWAWMRVPADAAPGGYAGSVTVAAAGKTVVLPVSLKIWPIRLEQVLPYSFGLWYSAPAMADPVARRRIVTEQLKFMVDIGLTGVTVDGPETDGVPRGFLYEIAREVGMGRHPLQMSLSSSLGMGRAIGRKHLDTRVDRNPGCELELPQFKAEFITGARKYAEFLKQCGLPVAVQSVDEPRDTPNPWNRNLEQTDLYADYLREAGVGNILVTPMGDTNSGRDYTALVDHHDIIATHAGRPSERLMTLTPQKGRTLWLYNCGMDRLSWGFYNWRVGSTGRWEWHFRWSEGGGEDRGYLNEEWYNPFTPLNAFAPEAPASYPGAMLFSSRFLTCADGITDSAYLCTLEKALQAARGNPARAGAVARADALLAGIRQEVPFLPSVKGIASIADGALVGQGLSTPVAARCEEWRRQIAELLIALQ